MNTNDCREPRDSQYIKRITEQSIDCFHFLKVLSCIIVSKWRIRVHCEVCVNRERRGELFGWTLASRHKLKRRSSPRCLSIQPTEWTPCQSFPSTRIWRLIVEWSQRLSIICHWKRCHESNHLCKSSSSMAICGIAHQREPSRHLPHSWCINNVSEG